MEIKRDCFAYFRSDCKALKIIDCEQCSFYKTSRRVQGDRAKAKSRIEQLDQATKEHIMAKYYPKQ